MGSLTYFCSYPNRKRLATEVTENTEFIDEKDKRGQISDALNRPMFLTIHLFLLGDLCVLCGCFFSL
jgi:hypothetical protein